MAEEQNYDPQTHEQFFNDFKRRRSAIVKVLTTDFEEFYIECDPDSSRRLRLRGLSNRQWDIVEFGEYRYDFRLPQPIAGINLARNAMPEKEWLSLVAAQSDAWLVSVAGYTTNQRDRLFTKIRNLPTVSDVVKKGSEKQPKNSSASASNSTKGKSAEDDDCDTLSGLCNKYDTPDYFWVICDICETWFHGK